MTDQEAAKALIESSNPTTPVAAVPFAGLLRSKLYIPPKRSQLVLRPRLNERLDEGLSRKLTLISAPPGFGKTTAISDWIAQSPYPVTWVSLDDGDNDPIRFWSYFIAALQILSAKIGVHSTVLLQSLQPIQIESVLTFLVNEIDTFPDNFVLVLEDYHLINALAIHQGLTFLLDHLPPRMHLYMTSRSDPPLPLAQLRARNELVELRVADLRFTPDETATFLNHTMGLNLIAEHIAVLEMRTEGWVAGLQLAALSMRGRDDLPAFIKAFAGSNRFILDYLAEQVLTRQSEDVQVFLLQTSILDRMSASLCNALTGNDNGQGILEQLEQRNLFIVPLDEIRQWYRYHPLFADMLRAHLRQLDSGALSRLHQRASVWFDQHDLLSEAVEHALAGQDYDHAGQLIEQMAEILFNNTALLRTLESWLSKLPDNIVRTNPKLGVSQAWVFINHNNIDAGLGCTDIAEEAIKHLPAESDTQLLRGEIAALRARIAVSRGTSDEIIDYAQQALTHLSANNASRRSLVMLTLGRAYLRQNDFARSSESFAESASLAHAAGSSYITLLATYFRAYLQRALGALELSKASYREALHRANDYGENAYFEMGIILMGLADLLCEANELPQALDYAQEGVKRCAQLGDLGFVLLSKLVLARIQQAMGELTLALDEIQETERIARQHQIDWAISIMTAYKAQLRIIQSHYAATNAMEWMPMPLTEKVSQRLARDSELFVYGYEHSQIVPMQLMVVQGRATADISLLQQALTLLEALRQESDTDGLLWLRIKTRVLMTLAYNALGDQRSAHEHLEQAILLAEPQAYIRIFVDEGEPLYDVMESMATSSKAANYIHVLLTAFGNEPSWKETQPSISRPVLSFHAPSLIEQLSEREHEVLHLIAGGDSNQEIADRLVISIATVKRHISNIYGKLAVTSRTHALVRAKELDLL